MLASLRVQGPFLSLFLVLVTLILISPLARESALGGSILQGGYTLVLLASVWAVRGRTPQRLALWAVGVPALVAGWATEVTDATGINMAGDILMVAFTAVVAWVLIAHVARAQRVTGDTLYAAFSAYLLIGVLFASVYMILETVQPGSLGIATGADGTTRNWDAFYFSLVTLTTLGYGDISPNFGLARSVAPMEAVFGQLYMAALVARLVGLWTAAQASAGGPEE
jgi:hypothetical protein